MRTSPRGECNKMKIVVAPDSFKGTFSAREAADIIERGVVKVFSEARLTKVPMADGGEGTVEALVDATYGKIVKANVTGPLGEKTEAQYGILGDGKTAAIEVAAASGLPLIPRGHANPMNATTFGTGELLKDALDKGCTKFIIGLGGSATNDGGSGLAKALGVRFLDKCGKDIGAGGGSLNKLNSIDIGGIDKRLQNCSFTAACDVDNPLCGESGASYVFGPQKGANSEMVKVLDEGLANFARVAKIHLGKDIKNIPGTGAAGGLGGGLIAFFGARLCRGIDIVIEATQLENKIKDADLVITGEGAMDFQTAYGKTPYGVAQAAKKCGKPVIAIAGCLEKGYETLYDKGFDAIFSTADKPMNLEKAMGDGAVLLENAAERVMRAVKIGICMKSITIG